MEKDTIHLFEIGKELDRYDAQENEIYKKSIQYKKETLKKYNSILHNADLSIEELKKLNVKINLLRSDLKTLPIETENLNYLSAEYGKNATLDLKQYRKDLKTLSDYCKAKIEFKEVEKKPSNRVLDSVLHSLHEELNDKIWEDCSFPTLLEVFNNGEGKNFRIKKEEVTTFHVLLHKLYKFLELPQTKKEWAYPILKKRLTSKGSFDGNSKKKTKYDKIIDNIFSKHLKKID